MATIDWQTPPYPGKTVAKSAIIILPTAPYGPGTTTLYHDPSVIGEHIGSADIFTRTDTVVIAKDVYVSSYQFQFKPDNPGDNGPWAISVLFTTEGLLTYGLVKRSGSFEVTLKAVAQIRQLSDNSVVFNEHLRSLKFYRHGSPAPYYIGDSFVDTIHLGPNEYELRLLTFMEIVFCPGKAWMRKGWLKLKSLSPKHPLTYIKLKIL